MENDFKMNLFKQPSVDYRDNGTEDVRDKLNIMTNKFLSVKKERDKYQKENKELKEEVQELQHKMRQMIPGFSNTSSMFPLTHELKDQINKFFSLTCLDIFFDLLCPELNFEGLFHFYSKSFTKVREILKFHFDPFEEMLKNTIVSDEVYKPIDSVLKKSYQANYKQILLKIGKHEHILQIMHHIQKNLSLMDCSKEANDMIVEFLKQTLETFFFSHISDPPFLLDIGAIGTKVIFNQAKHVSMDGFLAPKTECYIILPPVYFKEINIENIIRKPSVLPLDYEFPP